MFHSDSKKEKNFIKHCSFIFARRQEFASEKVKDSIANGDNNITDVIASLRSFVNLLINSSFQLFQNNAIEVGLLKSIQTQSMN